MLSLLLCLLSLLGKDKVMLTNVKKIKYILIILGITSFLGCKEEQPDTYKVVQDKDILKPELIIVKQEESPVAYLVDGVDSLGNSFVGEVVVKGEVGAGHITKDSLSPQIYIEVRRVQEGGLIGTDTNGIEYKLSFKTESNS